MTRPNKHSFINRMNLQTISNSGVGTDMCNAANLNTVFQNGVCSTPVRIDSALIGGWIR